MIAALATDSPATLVTIIGLLVTGQTIVIRWLMSRSDRLVDSLTQAVQSFQAFERQEDEVHNKITSSLERMVATQERILAILAERNHKESAP